VYGSFGVKEHKAKKGCNAEVFAFGIQIYKSLVYKYTKHRREDAIKVVFRSRPQTHFAILPPSRLSVPGIFHNVHVDDHRHYDMMAEMQRLRGRVYEADGAIHPAELTADGRHKLSVDERSWHVLSLDARGQVVACLRYLEESHASGFDALYVRHAALSRCPIRGQRFRRAVELEMRRARHVPIGFGEVGGWAVAEDYRWTPESLRIVLATYALLELLGSCAGVATATFRHSSASILQRIGLTALWADGEEMAPYHDPLYGCLMQVLQFDSRSPSPKYRGWILDLCGDLTTAPVVCRENRSAFGRLWCGLGTPELVPVAV
jgi:hypothetical protein